MPVKSHALAREIALLTLTKKASDVVIMHVKPLTDVTDYFVVCSADSDTQVKAIADAVDDGMRENGVRVWKSEGYQNLQWVLLDFVDVVLHVFQKHTRDYYSLEKLWGDAKMERVSDTPEPAPEKKKAVKRAAPKKKE